jgi:hypothetical protein
MSDEPEKPRFREHLHEMREALGGIGHDLRTDAADAPHLARVGTKGLLERAAGVKRRPPHEWSEPADEAQR